MPTPATQKSNAKSDEPNKKGSRAPPKPNDKAFKTALDENKAKIDKLQEQLVSFYSGSGQSGRLKPDLRAYWALSKLDECMHVWQEVAYIFVVW